MRLPVNQIQSSYILDEQGRPVCDAMIGNLGTEYLLLCEGAAPDAILARLHAAAAHFPQATIANRTDTLGLVSIDGPYSWELLKGFLGFGVIGTRYLDVLTEQRIGAISVTLVRAGKTGEFGYIAIIEAAQTAALWQALKEAGARFNLLPIGYRVADVCKVENGVPSVHHEGALVGNVLELNTRVLFGRDKDDFTGRAALLPVLQSGVEQRIVCVTFDPALPAAVAAPDPGAPVHLGGRTVGRLANVVQSRTRGRWIGLALLHQEFACAGVDYTVPLAEGAVSVSTVSLPFIFNKSLSVRTQEDSYFA